MPVGRPLGAKLYIEGKEVPFIGASFTNTVNTASIAYIDIVPHQAINDIKPRTHVVLAVRDHTDPQQDYPYVLAWEGEVFGYSMGRTTSSRTFTLQCIDLSGYWDNVLTYFFNTLQSLGKGAKTMTTSASEQIDSKASGVKTQTTTHSTTSYIRKIIESKFGSLANADFLDAFVAVYEDIAEINSFYQLSEDRLRISDKIVLRSSGKLNTLLPATQAFEWLESVTTRNAGYTSLRAVIQDLLSLIFHDYLTVPFPARVQKDNLQGESVRSPDNKKRTVGSFVFKPNLYMIPPPMCNVFFPDEYASFQFRRNFFKEPTRMNYRPELPRFLAADVTLNAVYEPQSYADYMQKRGGVSPDGDASATGVESGDATAFNDENTGDTAKVNPVKREGNFLTNEEKIKGIFLANERMLPATTEFGTKIGALTRKDFLKKVSSYLFFKKRFQDRGLQITSHLKLSVVPGFSVMILDDSDSDQNVLAYCSSVSHRIYATEGGYTNVTLSYARLATERDPSSNRAAEPVIPPWYDEAVFGEIATPPESKSAKTEVRDRGDQLVAPAELTTFYRDLLGNRSSSTGTRALTNYDVNESTIVGSMRALLRNYKTEKAKGSEGLQDFIAKTTSRDYIRIRDYFKFIGATTQTKDLRETSFSEFRGDSYDGVGTDIEGPIKDKHTIIDRYRNELKDNRGFRG